MNGTARSKLVLIAVAVAVSFAAAPPEAKGFSPTGQFFGRRDVDTTIPDPYRRSFKTSRHDVVMRFQGTYWRSITNEAAVGPQWRKEAFCDALTASDRKQGLIPPGFRYTPADDGFVYLLRSQSAPVASTPPPKPITSKPRTTSRPARSQAAASSAPVASSKRPVAQDDRSYRTAVGNVLMVWKGDHFEGHASPEVRHGLSAPRFCEVASAQDRLKGKLAYDQAYVLLADDTLVAVQRSSQLGRLAEGR